MKYRHTVISLTLALLATRAAVGAPVASTAESIARGKSLYLQYCTDCHGKDGRALVDVISDATDLTDPEAYYSGTSDREIFTSIRDGAGVSMPPWSFQIKDETDIWHLVNFIRSLWPAVAGEAHE